MAEEMRTCKTCGETKPLAAGFYKNRTDYDSKVYYRRECKRCWDKAMGERNKQRGKKTETAAVGRRTCKTCGETKPAATGFNIAKRRDGKTYYFTTCRTCQNKEIRRKRAEKRAAGEIADTVRTEYAAMTAARLHEHIRAAHAACPILGTGLWTQPARECA